jgi:hypothetical protein
MQTTGTPGRARYGFYTPSMLPYPTDVSNYFYIEDGTRYDVSNFSIHYLMSAFSPYNAVLMKFSLQTTTSSPAHGAF